MPQSLKTHALTPVPPPWHPRYTQPDDYAQPASFTSVVKQSLSSTYQEKWMTNVEGLSCEAILRMMPGLQPEGQVSKGQPRIAACGLWMQPEAGCAFEASSRAHLVPRQCRRVQQLTQ